jgi:hypothetical protein
MRKHTKRKVVWSTQINTVLHAITGASITPRQTLDKLRLMEYTALEAMVKGKGTIQDWRTLVDLLNLSEMLAKNGIGKDEVLPVCQKAQEGLHKAAMRYQSTLQMGLDGEALKSIRELLEYADLQQGSITRSEFEKYVKKTRDYIKSNGNLVVEIE